MISAVIITKNEAWCIEKCIESLWPVVDEIIIVDSLSTDNTVALASAAGAKTISQQWLGFGPQKNLGIRAAKYDYILSIDADEQLDKLLQEDINHQKTKGLNGAYSFRFLHHYYGRPVYYGLENPQWKIRLFNRTEMMWDEKEVHESLAIPKNYPVSRLKGRMLHYGYSSLEQHAQKSNAYSSLGAAELFRKGKKNYGWKMILSPAFTFFQSYFLKLGFLDGRLGWILAKWNAYTTWLKYSKLWELHHPNTSANIHNKANQPKS